MLFHRPFFNLKTINAQLTKVSGGLVPPKSSPDELLGELFQDVQLKRVYPDGMTFVDLVPAHKLNKILKAYETQRTNPKFDLHKFVAQHFKEYLGSPVDYKTNPKHSVVQHIEELWDVLTREAYRNRGSQIALPYPYLVPGGRFGAQFYWDSYFIMLGLAASGRHDTVEGMVKNYAFMIRKFGHIPTGSRTYFMSRSQPPFFSHMVRLLAEHQGKTALVRYLPYLLAEHRFWMKGTKELRHQPAYRRVVKMPGGEILNRYYDNKRTPRPESYKEDVDIALQATDRVASKVYVDLRAGAESGWDFSSRLFKDGTNLRTVHTTDLIPVDLNCLLVQLEQTIADAYKVLKQNTLSAKYQQQAQRRSDAIQHYCWSKDEGFYFDYDFITNQQTGCYSLASVFPLYAQIASQKQAQAVATMLRKKFLKTGGLVTTLATTGQQWDAPNGWAPLHWVAIQALRNYGYHDLANEIKKRWIQTNTNIYNEHRKLVEKYNVIDPSMSAGGGEYLLQDGFGWTNGVLLALLHEDRKKARSK